MQAINRTPRVKTRRMKDPQVVEEFGVRQPMLAMGNAIALQ